MTRAKLVDVFAIGSDTGFFGSTTFACGVSWNVPIRSTFAFATVAGAMVRSGAQFSIVTVAGEVVTFAIISRHHLVRIVSWITFTFATDAIPPVVA